MTKREEFWNAYYRALKENIAKNPDDYVMRPGETPEGAASKTAARLELAAAKDKSFKGISYSGSKAFRAAAKEVGIPFNLEGLNSLYKD